MENIIEIKRVIADGAALERKAAGFDEILAAVFSFISCAPKP
jgi:hypothetical protein